ncbi:MAG TPA: hypothetical protein VFW45_17055 [Candidatus Polarisedimenticolia bacterium]|nr:hypothetical protein [Candidatus Polarisedimenticolia bacterium]
MHVKWTKSAIPVLVGIACMVAPAGTAFANCPSAPILHGLTSSFEGCTPNAQAFFWGHGRAVQRLLANEANGATAGPAGHDSGRLANFADLIFIDGPNGGAANGSYLGNTDGGNTGSDGCFLNAALVDTNCPNTGSGSGTCCGGAADFGVVDYAIGGQLPADPNQAVMAAVSVDFNQFFQQHVLDQAGVVAGQVCQSGTQDGNICNFDGDGGCGKLSIVTCQPIPKPQITASSLVAGGANITVGVGPFDVANAIFDDCVVADSRQVNCPRNLYAGRVIVFTHGGCTSSTAASLPRVAFTMPATLPAAVAPIPQNWLILSREDANLNGVLDAGEDGTNGGVVNQRLDPYFITGGSAGSTTVFVPAVAGATDCIFLGTAIGLDDNRKFVNPPTNTIVGELVLSPFVSVNTNPIKAGSGTPVSDQVIELRASKTQGKGNVDWTTGVELTTAGFNVIGAKKGGAGEVKINANLIAAKEGTTGKGASYTLSFDAGQLKGSSAVYVEVVKNDGSKERFGPVSF